MRAGLFERANRLQSYWENEYIKPANSDLNSSSEFRIGSQCYDMLLTRSIILRCLISDLSQITYNPPSTPTSVQNDRSESIPYPSKPMHALNLSTCRSTSKLYPLTRRECLLSCNVWPLAPSSCGFGRPISHMGCTSGDVWRHCPRGARLPGESDDALQPVQIWDV